MVYGVVGSTGASHFSVLAERELKLPLGPKTGPPKTIAFQCMLTTLRLARIRSIFMYIHS